MATLEQCVNCTEPCPQAEAAHEIARGRMYATNELIALVKKMEYGQFVEVVRCKDCRSLYDEPDDYCCFNHKGLAHITPDSYCSYGERRDKNE